MRTQSNESIMSEVNNNCFITEKQINLLKNRSNKAGKDVINYELLCSNMESIPVTYEQGQKGLRWLQGLLKRNGEPKKCAENLGYREIDIIQNATANDFSFVQLHNIGNKWVNIFVPVYRCGAMVYYVHGGKIEIVG